MNDPRLALAGFVTGLLVGMTLFRSVCVSIGFSQKGALANSRLLAVPDHVAPDSPIVALIEFNGRLLRIDREPTHKAC